MTYTKLLVFAVMFRMFDAAQAKDYGFKGEYILSRNETHNPVCRAFTRNLNEFRRIRFNECNPRLSSKFPEFSRPMWTEIPYDLRVVENYIRGWGRRETPNDDERWEAWLRANPGIQTGGRARMWSTRVDVDGDGKAETIYRIYPSPAVLYPRRPPEIALPPHPLAECNYNLGELRLGSDARPEVAKSFNQGAGGSDLIRFAQDGRYYIVQWMTGYPADYEIGTKIGATDSVVLFRFDWNLDHIAAGSECLIEWVPTGRYRPLKHRAQ
jgi:hypothetical protein